MCKFTEVKLYVSLGNSWKGDIFCKYGVYYD